MSEPLCYFCLQTGHQVLAHRILRGGKGVCRDHFQGALMPVTEIEPLNQRSIESLNHRVIEPLEETEEKEMGARKEIDVEELKRLHGEGLPDGEIGKHLGCSTGTILGRRRKLGLPANRGSFGKRRASRQPKAVAAIERKAARIEQRLSEHFGEGAPTIIASDALCNAVWAALPLVQKAQLLNKLGDLDLAA